MSQNMMNVSSLNTKIKSLLEATFMHIMVEGEVASATYHSSGHLYFSIKDKTSSIKCVMWRSAVAKMKFRIEKGMHIVVEGSVSVYTPRGEYQFQILRIEPYGQGALALAYEQLKERLKEKGYFDSQRKKPMPKYITKIALVTAKDSAALYDMLKIIEKRWPLLDVVIVDTLVQGESSAGQIAKSLFYADSLGMDVVIVGRGGGSAEDLWAFNEEVVADVLYGMKTPVVSAVGHEVDVLISDYVADLRAPTPSAAIEMILPDINEIRFTLDEISERFSYIVRQKIQNCDRDIKHVEEILIRSSPSRKLDETSETFKHLEEELKRVLAYKLEQYGEYLPRLLRNYSQSMMLLLQQKEQHLEYVQKKLSMNDPKLQLRKGWGQVSIENKTIDLSSIKLNQKFIIEDIKVQIEALCLEIR